jgi:NADH:ubiquinone oxidoreductase subunit D
MQEHAYCLAVEALLGSTSYLTHVSRVRIVFDELTRLLNHLIAISGHALDVGCMSVFFWAFEDRERIMEFYERVSGARMHAAFYRPNEISTEFISRGLVKDIVLFCRTFLNSLGQIEGKLCLSSIWQLRLADVGVVSPELSLEYGLTGPLARSAGLHRDIRLGRGESYDGYFYLNIRSFVGTGGDCYDRFLIRMREMSESVHIILQSLGCLSSSAAGFNLASSRLGRISRRLRGWHLGMEDLIKHFKTYSGGDLIQPGLTYQGVESAKGEFGVLLASDGSSRPFRCRIRAPAFLHSQAFAPLCRGHLFSDLVTIVGAQDIVLGEVDR